MRFFAFLCLGGLLAASAGDTSVDAATMVVQGTGYPPVRAQNKAQALLMAKRAAILDAYRNAVRERGSAERLPEESDYEGLAAFVRGMTILREECLADGAVRIEASVPAGSETPRRPAPRSGAPEGSGGPAVRRAPIPITLDEWYVLIERMVVFESRGERKDKP